MVELTEGGAKALAAELQKPVVAPQLTGHPNGNDSLVAIRDGYKLEKLPGAMVKARSHIFHDLTSFAEWLNRHADDQKQETEILAGEDRVLAALSPTNPSGDIVTCLLRAHPRFQQWVAVFGKTLTQKSFHAFVRANQDAFPRSGDKPSIGDVLGTELQRLQLVEGKDLQTELDERGFYRFAGASQKQNVGGAIPPRFTVVVPIFNGVRVPESDGAEQSYGLDCLLSMDVADGHVSFVVSCPSLPVVMHQARLDAVAWLRFLLTDGFLVGLGDLSLRDVPFVG